MILWKVHDELTIPHIVSRSTSPVRVPVYTIHMKQPRYHCSGITSAIEHYFYQWDVLPRANWPKRTLTPTTGVRILVCAHVSHSRLGKSPNVILDSFRMHTESSAKKILSIGPPNSNSTGTVRCTLRTKIWKTFFTVLTDGWR